jgi:hypothetical protein
VHRISGPSLPGIVHVGIPDVGHLYTQLGLKGCVGMLHLFVTRMILITTGLMKTNPFQPDHLWFCHVNNNLHVLFGDSPGKDMRKVVTGQVDQRVRNCASIIEDTVL